MAHQRAGPPNDESVSRVTASIRGSRFSSEERFRLALRAARRWTGVEVDPGMLRASDDSLCLFDLP